MYTIGGFDWPTDEFKSDVETKTACRESCGPLLLMDAFRAARL